MDDTRSTPEPEDHARTSQDRRRPYKTPSLTEYGAVAKLTQNMQNGSRVDGNGMRQYGA